MEVYNKSLCQPRELLVEIAQEYPEEVEHIFIPSCVVLTRCAGCCNDEMLECTPTSTHNITMEVRDRAFYIWTLTSPSHFFYNPTSTYTGYITKEVRYWPLTFDCLTPYLLHLDWTPPQNGIYNIMEVKHLTPCFFLFVLIPLSPMSPHNTVTSLWRWEPFKL